VRTIKMKPPSPKCKACGPDATITDDLAEADYDEFCEAVLVDELTGEVVGAPGERVGAKVGLRYARKLNLPLSTRPGLC
jgi:adenylyltransferase/sulfurtransferase